MRSRGLIRDVLLAFANSLRFHAGADADYVEFY